MIDDDDDDDDDDNDDDDDCAIVFPFQYYRWHLLI